MQHMPIEKLFIFLLLLVESLVEYTLSPIIGCPIDANELGFDESFLF